MRDVGIGVMSVRRVKFVGIGGGMGVSLGYGANLHINVYGVRGHDTCMVKKKQIFLLTAN
jgi:hypothetical protein